MAMLNPMSLQMFQGKIKISPPVIPVGLVGHLQILYCVKCVQIRSFFWSVFSCIRTEYGDLRSKSPYSVRIQENTDQKKLRIWTLFT